jgi:hypothetical protein
MNKSSRHVKGSQSASNEVILIAVVCLLSTLTGLLILWGDAERGKLIETDVLLLLAITVTGYWWKNRRGLVGRFVRDVDKKAEPPIIAEFLVGLCAKDRYRNGLLQNLEDDFDRSLAAGTTVRRARRKYWAAALNSIGPQLLAAAKRVGIIGLIADYARRLLH